MNIKKFNQLFESFDDSHFTISDETIEDICTEMTDVGYNLVINKRYINIDIKNGSPGITDEPIADNVSPIYEIGLDSKENYMINKPIEYWNGGSYYQDANLLTIFDSIVNRFKKMFKDAKVLWLIRSGESFRIRIILNKIQAKAVFDRYNFEKRVNDWSESFGFYSAVKCTENFGNSSSKNLQFMRHYGKKELTEILNKTSEKIIDNKSDFDEVLVSFEEKFGKEASHVGINTPVKWDYWFQELEVFEHQPPKSTFFSPRPDKVKFVWYSLEIKYQVVKK